ncbi:hypothetical protein GOV14_06400 [Candidatus Pacearchaeota archaeon]|nr:hypothetical protein [Candidatus Pacearchaeota archaeon]
MKKRKRKEKPSLKRDLKKTEKILYALIIGFAVISFWRGIWGLWDIYVFPKNIALSLWASTLVGLIILIGTHKVIRELM